MTRRTGAMRRNQRYKIGGVVAAAPPASPTLTETANLHFRYEGDLGVSTSGGKVDSWADQSGNGNTATETGTNRPVVDAAALNGYDVIDFSQANQERLTVATLHSVMTPPFTLYIVLNTDSAAAVRYAAGGENTARRADFYIDGSSNYVFFPGNAAGTCGTAVATTWTALCGISDATCSAFKDNFTTAANTGSWGSDNLQGLHIGGRFDYVSTQHWDGKIAAYLGYSVAHDSTQRTAVASYLNDKYGLSIT